MIHTACNHRASFVSPIPALLIFQCFASAQTLSDLSPGQRRLELLGNRSQIPELSTQWTTRGQGVQDLEEYGGRIYIAMGDWNDNTGPIDIVYYDTLTKSFEVHHADSPTEEICQTEKLNGKLFMMMGDPRGWEGPAFMRLDAPGGSFTPAATIRSAAHYLDVTWSGDRLYMATRHWFCGGQRGCNPEETVPIEEIARVYSSADFGATWQLETTAPSSWFYHIEADASTVFLAGNTGDNRVKENGVWRTLSSGGVYRPVALNGVMRLIPAASNDQFVHKVSGDLIVNAETKPFPNQAIKANDVSDPEAAFGRQIFWAIGTSADGSGQEIYATSDWSDWVTIVDLGSQGTDKPVFDKVTRLTYLNNVLYLGTTDGSLYALRDIFNFGTNPLPPAITAHPAGQRVMEGASATFSVTAAGAGLSYQWQKDGGDISGATAAAYTTPAAALADNGAAYRCIVSNSVGSDTSDAATLTVNMPLPNAPALLSPAHMDTLKPDSLLCRWGNAAPHVTRYQIQVFTDSSLSSIFLSDSALDDTSAMLKNMPDNASYWWRIRAANAAGWGSYSDIRQFTVRIPSAALLPSVFSVSLAGASIHDGLIKYDIPKLCAVYIDVFNVSGRTIYSFANTRQQPGFYGVNANAGQLAPGRYSLRFIAGEYKRSISFFIE